MKNATLVIYDSEKFVDDIWQYTRDFNEQEWKSSIESMADNLNKIYKYMLTTEEHGAGSCELYMLGDVINMLKSIDVRKEK